MLKIYTKKSLTCQISLIVPVTIAKLSLTYAKQSINILVFQKPVSIHHAQMQTPASLSSVLTSI